MNYNDCNELKINSLSPSVITGSEQLIKPEHRRNEEESAVRYDVNIYNLRSMSQTAKHQIDAIR